MRQKDDSISEVILISPEDRKQHRYLPFALLYLSSFLEAKGVSTKIIDLKEKPGIFFKQNKQIDFKETYIKTIINTIKKDNPLLIGLTCYTAEYNSVMEIAKTIKKAVGTTIVVGGVHATLMQQDFLFEGSPVDFAVIGDGETPLLRLFESLKYKNANIYKKAKGIAYFDTVENKIIDNGCNIESDLTKFPMPDYRKIDMKFYLEPNKENIRWLLLSGVQIFTGRGCPYKCEFCAVNFLNSLNKESSKMRYRSIDQIIEELEILKSEYHIDGFYIIDDCFMVSKKRTIEFCQKLIKKRLNLIWGAETRVNLLIRDESLLRLMKQAGLIQLDFGVESGSPKMLKEINKQITIEQVKKAFELCRKYRIRTYANILFNIPNETKEDVLLTHKFLKDIKPSVVGCGTMVPLLGTPIYEKYVNPKLTKHEYQIYNLNVYEEIVDERFRLGKHNLNFTKIVRNLNNKYSDLKTISLSSVYLKKILTSYRLQYYIVGYFKMLLKSICGMIIDIDNYLLRGFLRKTVKNILAIWVKMKNEKSEYAIQT